MKYTTWHLKKKSSLNFTHKLNKNQKIPFLDVLIDTTTTTNNNNLITSTDKKKIQINPVPSTLNTYLSNFFLMQPDALQL